MNDPMFSLAELGWSNFYMSQLDLDDLEEFTPMRVAEVARSNLRALSADGTQQITTPPDLSTGELAVGDWVLVDPNNMRISRVLERRSVIARKGSGPEARHQLIAANVDTMFIVSSCNADFNPARLERYIALALDGGAQPVIVLTKADLADDAQHYKDRARDISPLADAVVLNAKHPEDLQRLQPWCKAGQTVALVGSSGVGKSTLTNGLAGTSLVTADIREDDAKGRHTTTNRALYPMTGGGWLIDTPGMREIGMQKSAEGIDAVFGDIVALAGQCKFGDCAHETEPGCAVKDAIANGELDAYRLIRWRKLQREDRRHTDTLAQSREKSRALNKKYTAGKARAKAKKGDFY